MNLALFDLDHTLIPFDSGMAWTRFLIARGRLPASAQASYLAYAKDYVAGTLDIHAMHRGNMAPLAVQTRATLDAWSAEFAAETAARIPQAMRDLVDRHRAAGDLCAIVTATTRLISGAFGKLFGIEHVLATEAATVDDDPHGAYTGEIAGEPCFHAHKITHVERWLAGRGLSLQGFERSWFYSDSASDLPLLRAVTDPIAVKPDARLRAVAEAEGWPIIEAA